MSERTETVAEAFSRTAAKYDAFAENHPHLTRMRNKVYAHLRSYLPAGARILELNAGSGVDAVYLAGQGYRVHATDVAAGMLARLRGKVEGRGLSDRITVQECSFTDLSRIEGGPYDAVFSNLGGLNCIPELAPVIRGLPHVIRAGGLVTWVLMPPICLWELAELLRGHPRLAFRRRSRAGVRSHLEGLYFDVHYFSPKEVVAKFGRDYRLLRLEGLSVITPTAESKHLAVRAPRLYSALCWLDDRLAPRRPWSGWGDFYILSLRYAPQGGSRELPESP